jgi:hypothetical protein
MPTYPGNAMTASFATIDHRMPSNPFARFSSLPGGGDPAQPAGVPGQAGPAQPPATPSPSPQPRTGRTFPADEVVWGIVIRNGFDELDDPWYHRGTTQHAYLEGNDNVAICGFRPPQSGPRTRRRARLGMPTPGEHPMCGMCARMVVAPRPRVPVPVQPARSVAVPVVPAPQPVPVARPYVPAGTALASPAAGATSPWVRRATGGSTPVAQPRSDHDAGLMARGVHADKED